MPPDEELKTILFSPSLLTPTKYRAFSLLVVSKGVLLMRAT
jgi:hypothetical protein